MKKYALLGRKLSHSHSPLIHTEIFKDLNIDATYELLELEPEDLHKFVDLLKSGEYSGFNVTIPYKKDVIKYLDMISNEAKAIGACNTIAYKDGRIIGYNTDYYGFYETIKYNNIDCRNKDCYILGTGGASLAVAKALADLGGNIKYVSRTPNNINTISYNDLYKIEKPYLVVNTTPVGMYPNIDASPLDSNYAKNILNVVDIIFNPKITKLLSDSNSNINGLFMLVGQAIKAEEIWQDKKYDKSIIDLLKRIEMMI